MRKQIISIFLFSVLAIMSLSACAKERDSDRISSISVANKKENETTSDKKETEDDTTRTYVALSDAPEDKFYHVSSFLVEYKKDYIVITDGIAIWGSYNSQTGIVEFSEVDVATGETLWVRKLNATITDEELVLGNDDGLRTTYKRYY